MRMAGILLSLLSVGAFAQTAPSAPADSAARATQSLPSAPQPQPASHVNQAVGAGDRKSEISSASNDVGAGTPLSLQDAEELAVKNNPQITVGRLAALASEQVTREVRSNFWPTATANLTAVDSRPGSRITAGGLNNPIIYQRAAAGLSVSQLITDFGRTRNLASSASFAAKAENQNAIATKEQVLLAVDQAFFGALQAGAVLTVAQQTVSNRQTLVDQVQALFNSKLKSELDLSFANVNLAQAKLLSLDAQNNQSSALADLSALLGYTQAQNFRLVEDGSAVLQPSSNADDLVAQAMNQRPEILAQEFRNKADQKFHNAEKDLFLPNIEALGVVGDAPVRDPVLSNWYGAMGVNVGIPIFNGFLFSARSKQSDLQAQASQARLLDLRNKISRDVRTSWLNANAAFQKLSVTQQLLDQANLALNLAQTRYNLGLSSIVELSQAQLQQTEAQIRMAQAGYDYRLAQSILRYQTTGL